jgi:membrane protease YdiL (CAAX protease family)
MIHSWKLEAVARLLLGLIATYCFGMLLAGLVEHFVSGSAQGPNDFWQILAAMLFLQIPALVWISLFLRQHGIGWAEAFGLKPSKPAAAVARGLLVGAFFLPAAWAVEWISQSAMESVGLRPQAQAAVQVLQDPSLTVTAKVVMGVITIILAPAVEEPLFRGILYPAIKQQGYPRLALWGSSALFAALHFNRLTFLPLLFFAMLLVYLYESLQSLLAPMAAHALFNAANFFFLLFGDQITQRWRLT